MQLQQRINAFDKLGDYLNLLASSNQPDETALLENAKAHNGWFNLDNLRFALNTWGTALTKSNLDAWVSGYNISEENTKTIAIIMAGNVPLVGFHDFLSVLISGHKALVKLSSNDKILLPYLTKKLIEIEPGFEDRIQFTDEKLENFDAVIATGSNNSARYFEYYFGKYPHIIRKNRNSVAVLSGNESPEDLELLAHDIFRYFGLGCRNVSKLYLPKNYNFDPFFNAMFSWKKVINDSKYMNNYDYNKAVYLMSNINLLDNEFLLLKEDNGFSSPISVVFYEYYDTLESVAKDLETNAENIQCLVSNVGFEDELSFGETQSPSLTDYADGVDTLKFLTEF
ncbi:MAG: acyl-CoA reductase [Flavobacteriaceae bacterium]|nr:acyl-CoA reductase [Flavobacteriaceae bacterium]